MNKNIFEKVDNVLYEGKLNNGLRVFLFPKNDTKNFYISISVKYGASVTKYKINNKTYTITPGSAHFLEHKVMALSENKEISKRINELGSLANAWTSYYGTNYNIFGSINIKENLRLLLDIFYNININEKCVEEEKGIIGEEIDMYEDEINSCMFNHLFNNIFVNSYAKNTVAATRKDIEKITAKELNRIYDHFYTPNNTFIIVCGNFDPETIMNEISIYMDNLNLKSKELPKIIKDKEVDKVGATYEEVQKNTDNIRVKYALKIPKKNFNFKNDTFLKYYISMILSCNFGTTSTTYEKYKSNNIINGMNYTINIIDDYFIVVINATCDNASIFLDNISKDIKHLKLDKKDFERKKKLFLKSYILDFDNIEDVEYNICDSVLMDDKINYNEYSDIINMNYNEAVRLMKQIKSDNISIIKTIK